MAREVVQDHLRMIAVSRHEAANIIALLSAQLGDTNIQGNQAGACPEIRIVENGKIRSIMSFVVDPTDTR